MTMVMKMVMLMAITIVINTNEGITYSFKGYIITLQEADSQRYP